MDGMARGQRYWLRSHSIAFGASRVELYEEPSRDFGRASRFYFADTHKTERPQAFTNCENARKTLYWTRTSNRRTRLLTSLSIYRLRMHMLPAEKARLE